jgi:hypothetical protein
MSDDDGSRNTIAPGTEYVVVAGELYDIEDESGKGLSLKGVESPWVMEFLSAFDAFRSIRNALGREHEQSVAAWQALEEKWEQMPMRLVRDMPSFRAGGIIVPGGS